MSTMPPSRDDKWKNGLNYGKVLDLFDQLTYNVARTDSARPYSDLTNKTLKHRKDFIKNDLDRRTPAATFPTEYENPDAQLCASTFLTQNYQLFQYDPSIPEAQVRDLRYPQNSKEIVNILAKIMCTQEVMYHRNLMSAEARKAGSKSDTITVTGIGHNEPQQPLSTVSSRRAIREVSKDPKPDPISIQPKDTFTQFEKEILPENIRINLDAAYPLDGKPDGSDKRWLFEVGSSWPEDLTPFAFRWIHEHKAYQPHGDESSVYTRNFIVDLKHHLKIFEVLPVEAEIQITKHVSSFLLSWVKTWIGCGLLLQKGNSVTRHKLLEEALTVRRAEYVATVLDGKPENNASMLTNSKLKRPANAMDEDLTLDVPDQLKRRKSATETTIEPASVIEAAVPHERRGRVLPPIQAQQVQLANSDILEQPSRQMSVAMELASVFGDGNVSTPKATTGSSYTIPLLSGPDSGTRTGRSTPTPSLAEDFIVSDDASKKIPFRYVPSLPPGTNPRLAESRIANKRHSLPQAKQSSSTPEPRATSADFKAESRRLSTPNGANGTPTPKVEDIINDATNKRLSATPDVKTGGPVLRLIVEEAGGSLNSKNPLFEHDLRNSSYEEFLTKVLSRRKDPTSLISRLKLMQRWGDKTSFTVTQTTSEDEWKEIRGDIRRNFAWQCEKKPGKSHLEVYIICECDSKMSDDEEEY